MQSQTVKQEDFYSIPKLRTMLTSLKRVDIGRNLKTIWVNEASMFLKMSEEMYQAFLGLVKLLAYIL